MEACEKIKIKPLGAGCEVGRSCIVLTYGNKNIMLDCGVHPAHTGTAALPFLDLVDLSKIDAVFITHFHLDHAAALPFLTEKTDFNGKVYMTHPTKAILRWLLDDYIRIINASSDTDFYTEKDLSNCYNKIISVDYHQEININGIKLVALNAGHVLGAAMFLITIEDSVVLYTGDFSREEDRHLKAAESPGCKVDALITESTYGVQCHLPRAERESRFTSLIQDIVTRGGRCLLPVFALGRAQELLLILEEHWTANPSLHSVPIYYASSLAKKCMSVYQTYINMMNDRIKKISLVKNPFAFRFVKNLKGIDFFEDKNPCVIMASPGMLQSGLSRELFEKWCSDKRNGLVIPGYVAEGTLARDVLNEPKEIISMKGHVLKLNMTVEYISFSAHVDFTQNSEFIDECQPTYLFFVHGEANEMNRLKNVIQHKNEKNGIQMELFTLRNGESGSFDVRKKSEAKAVGCLDGEFEGIIIRNHDDVQIYNKQDMRDIKYKPVVFTQRQKIPFNSTFCLLKQVLCENFEDIKEHEGSLKIRNIFISFSGEEVVLEWKSNYVDDVIALSINEKIKDISGSVKNVKLCKSTKKEALVKFLSSYFIVDEENEVIWVSDGKEKVSIQDYQVSEDSELGTKVTKIIERVDLIYS
ncbi:Cleavage and polyadenylation specificity factor 73 [Nosema granulosis]|uniref:Endoribonuclease YSH1 n=1 Tax=Nosema granulosis TaxID=83296 RepID=A0A9P6GZJ4_9MICR|nr:Cleavage and polyadenylation specificity factor 73 [Nosema granulosis]